MVNIKINFSNKTIYLLASIFVLIATIGVVYATMGSIPNPGHAISDLQTCENGETLVMSEGEWTCGSGSGLNCRVINQTFSNFGTVSCNEGEVLTGGACRDDGANQDILVASIGTYIQEGNYTCKADQGIRISVVCCKGKY